MAIAIRTHTRANAFLNTPRLTNSNRFTEDTHTHICSHDHYHEAICCWERASERLTHTRIQFVRAKTERTLVQFRLLLIFRTLHFGLWFSYVSRWRTQLNLYTHLVVVCTRCVWYDTSFFLFFFIFRCIHWFRTAAMFVRKTKELFHMFPYFQREWLSIHFKLMS